MESNRKPVLLLEGSGYINLDRPLTSKLGALLENVDPLGIRIVSELLRRKGIPTILRQMNPDMSGILKEVSEAASLFISSRFFDISMAQVAIEAAQRAGIPVVAGGYGPSYNEDSFPGVTRVVGEFEPVANEFIDDYLSGNLRGVYDAIRLSPHDITHDYVWPDRQHPSHNDGFRAITGHQRVAVEWMRGCSGFCTYCSVTRMQRGGVGRDRGVRVRDPGDIIAEQKSLGLNPGDFLFLTDNDTALIPRPDLLELLKWIKSQRLRFITEATVAPLLQDLEVYGQEDSLLAAMSPLDGQGGCFSLAYGADDIASNKVPGSQHKEKDLIVKVAEVFRRFGIPLNLMFILGLDTHTFPDSILQIAGMVEAAGAPMNFFFIATPYRDTVFGDGVYEKKGVFETNTTFFNHNHVVHEPLGMTSRQLQQGYHWLMRRFSSPYFLMEKARRNFNSRIWSKDPVLAGMLSGLPWGLYGLASVTELSLRKNFNPELQRYLDEEYKTWKRENG